jgi:hypothetical protein
MLKNVVMSVYRVLMGLVIALPITINYLLGGDLVTSLITIPSLCLVLAIIAIYGDKKLSTALNTIKLHSNSNNKKQPSPCCILKSSISTLFY